MFRKLLLAAVVVGATMVAMTPGDADARHRRYRSVYRAPARVSVGYAPRYYAPRYVAPRYGYGYGWGSPRYYSGYRGGVGIGIGGGGFYYGW